MLRRTEAVAADISGDRRRSKWPVPLTRILPPPAPERFAEPALCRAATL